MSLEDKLHREIGERLELFRKSLGMNQLTFANEHGFNPTQYRNWESGTRRIPIEKAALLEQRYRLTLDFIYLGRVSTLPHSIVMDLSLSPKDS